MKDFARFYRVTFLRWRYIEQTLVAMRDTPFSPYSFCFPVQPFRNCSRLKKLCAR